MLEQKPAHHKQPGDFKYQTVALETGKNSSIACKFFFFIIVSAHEIFREREMFSMIGIFFSATKGCALPSGAKTKCHDAKRCGRNVARTKFRNDKILQTNIKETYLPLTSILLV